MALDAISRQVAKVQANVHLGKTSILDRNRRTANASKASATDGLTKEHALREISVHMNTRKTRKDEVKAQANVREAPIKMIRKMREHAAQHANLKQVNLTMVSEASLQVRSLNDHHVRTG